MSYISGGSEKLLYLHGYREVILGLWRKENIHSFLWKWLVPSRWSPHFNDMQLETKRRWNKGRQSQVTKVSGQFFKCGNFDLDSTYYQTLVYYWPPFFKWVTPGFYIFIAVSLKLCSASTSYFSSCLSSHSKAEQSWLFSVALHLELCKASGMPLDGLRHLPVHWV